MFVSKDDFNAELAFSHPLERSANGPVDLCSEKPAAAGWGGVHGVGGGQWSIKTSFYFSSIPFTE